MKKQPTPLAGVGPLPPARTAEERQDQLTDLALRLVEQRLRDGTATSQETTHFLKLSTEKEKLERLKLEQEIELSKAKIKNLEAAEEAKQLAEAAIAAFRSYQPNYEEEYDEDI